MGRAGLMMGTPQAGSLRHRNRNIDLLADATIGEASKDDVSERVHNVGLLVSHAGC